MEVALPGQVTCDFPQNLKLAAVNLVSSRVSYRGYAVEQLVEELLYKSEGRGFDSR